MGKLTVPSSPTLYSTTYTGLKGLDCSCDATEVSRRRSPEMLNMISDEGGNPIKRLGWRVVNDLKCGKVKEIFVDNDTKYVIAEKGVWKITDEEVTQIIERENIQNASIFAFNGEVYIIIDGEYRKIGASVADFDYIPETIIGQKPDGTGGTYYEGVNLLCNQRKYSFLGDETSTEYRLFPKDGEEHYITKFLKVEVQDENGNFVATADYTTEPVEIKRGFHYNGEVGQYEVIPAVIKFNSPHKPVVTGQDNIRITFSPFDTKEITVNGETACRYCYNENRTNVLNSNIVRTYGYSSNDRVFIVAGNNRIYYSEVNKPNFIPDENYIVIGHTGKIKGLHRSGEYLVAITDDNSIESTTFLISGEVLDSQIIFGVRAANGGIGAISGDTFSTLSDEPLFLSRTGVYGITSYYATAEKLLRNRSYFIDKMLCAEPNLDKAISVVWNRYYIICVNGHAYILDGRGMTSEKYNNTNYIYETYYWDNIPACAMYVDKKELWFGTEDGKICKFNTDIDNVTAYCDNGTLSADGTMTGGTPIHAKWSTVLDDDDKPQYFKNLHKKGTLVTMVPYDRSSVSVSYSKNGDAPVFIGKAYMDIFNWSLIDFERFSFNASRQAQDAYTQKKVKKYKRLQFILENNELYEPFGIIGITKTYTIGNFAK